MIKKIGIGVIAILAIILLMATLQPASFSVKRSTTIAAPPDKVAALIGDFRNWPAWSPWERLDPDMKRSFSGAQSGTGAVYSWEGNSDVGAGRMEITEMAAPSRIVIELNFIKPLASRNVTEFALQPQGQSTAVTWTMHGPMHFVMKIMGVFIDTDALIGRDFEKGLAQLKAAAEK